MLLGEKCLAGVPTTLANGGSSVILPQLSQLSHFRFKCFPPEPFLKKICSNLFFFLLLLLLATTEPDVETKLSLFPNQPAST